MLEMGIESKIQNVHLLTNIFGHFPSFHDAEVKSIALTGGHKGEFAPELEALIHTFEMTSKVDNTGRYELKNHSLVHFRFLGIDRLNLVGFNHQNILQSLKIDYVDNDKDGMPKFEVEFVGIFGVDAEFSCKAITIESVEPFYLE
jgi:hypothetical protein